MILIKNKLDKKWYSLIWCALIFASLIRNSFGIYSGYVGQAFTAGEITLSIIMDIFFSGLLPAVVCYFCGIVLYGMLWRRGIVLMSRNDFAYWAMVFTAGARLIIGMVEVFSVLTPEIYPYTMSFFEELFLSLALYLMGLVFFKSYYNLNYRQIYNAYNVLCPVYLFFQGLNTLFPAGFILILKFNPAIANKLSDAMELYMGVKLSGVDVHLFVASIVAIVLFAILIAISVGLSFYLKKKAELCPAENNERSDNKNSINDDFNPFDEFSENKTQDSKDDDKVFDEFDI